MEFKTRLNSSSEKDDLTALIEDTDELIASVYEMFEQPRRTSPTTTPVVSPLRRRSVGEGNISGSSRFTPSPNILTSPLSPPLSTNLRSPVSTPRSHSVRQALCSAPDNDLEAEISRIDSFCDMLEQNLRSVPAGDDEEVGTTRWEAAGRRSPVTRAIAPRTPRSTPPRRRENLTPVAIIDLCDSMNMSSPCNSVPAHSARLSPCNDDVIIVSPSNSFVDLCTPSLDRSNLRSVNASRNRRGVGGTITSNNRNRPSSNSSARRRLVPSQRLRADENVASRDARSLGGTRSATQLPRSASRVCWSTVSTSTTNMQTQKNRDTEKLNCVAESVRSKSVGSAEERSIMCAVCMENPLNNQPTSTKCGHVFCASCINEAIRLTRKCPMCNTKLTSRMLFRIYI